MPENQKIANDGWVDVQVSEGTSISTAPPMSVYSNDGWEDVADKGNERPSFISEVARAIFKTTGLERLETSTYLYNQMKDNPDLEPKPGESLWDYDKRIYDSVLAPRETAIKQEGIGRQLESPMMGAIALGGITHPINTAISVGAFTGMDYFFNLRRFVEEKFPDTSPELKDIAELVDFGIKGGIIGKGLFEGKRFLNNFGKANGVPENVNISPENISKLKDSGNLLEAEKKDLFQTLGINDQHIESSNASGLPINVPTEKVTALGEKPYWQIAKQDILQKDYFFESPFGQKNVQNFMEKVRNLDLESLQNRSVKNLKSSLSVDNPGETRIPQIVKFQEFINNLKGKDNRLTSSEQKQFIKEIRKLPIPEKPYQRSPEIIKERNTLIKSIKSSLENKDIPNQTMKNIKDFMEVKNLKDSDIGRLRKIKDIVIGFKKEDRFLTEKQLTDLKDIIKELPNPEVTPKRIIVEKFGDKQDILNQDIQKIVDPRLMPTVDIKEGHPLVKKIVEDVSDKMIKAEDIINQRNKELDKLITSAEKSRAKLLTAEEKISRSITPQNKEIFQALSGEHVKLTPEEQTAVTYLKNFFGQAKKDLALEKYRRNYVTHLEKPFTEKILTKGLWGAIKDTLGEQKKKDLPVDVLLELDNIIGSDKFFKYSLERKGGIDPTSNIRTIVNSYSQLLERKKVLDSILPEAQAVTKNLLTGKSAVWMKQFLQNLKGRGLDNNFRNGPMGWLTKIADGMVDIGYLKLLGFNWKSPIKNIVAGESNAWIYQDFPTYLKGKQRFFSNPKKAYDMATKYGALEGTYSDYAQKGIGGLKKVQDWMMIGQKVGEAEIRSTIFASMLSEKEWKTGQISSAKFNEIKDTIAITQGIFTKWDTPLLLQTWYGRMFFQMNRWRITNANLLRRITVDALNDVKAGNFKTQNVSRFVKMTTAYGVGMYLSYQLADAGYKTASQVARNLAQTIDGITSLFTQGELARMITDNPTLHIFKEISNTVQNFSAYIHVPGAKKTKERGVEKTYIAPIKTVEDLQDFLESQ